MNIFRIAALRTLAVALTLPLLALAVAGCDIESVDSTTAVPSDNAGTIYNFSGLYMSPDTGTNGVMPLVYPFEGNSHPSGALITFLRLLQYGSVLEAYDSAGKTWAGSISGIAGSTASFSLTGSTTAGQPVEIAGTMNYVSQKSTMDATWIEPGYFGSIFAEATVSPATTNTPVSDLSISPTSATLSTNVPTQTFTVSGGNGNYTWSHTGSCGTLSDDSGSSIIYARISAGSDVVTVSDGDDAASASVTCQ